MLPTLSQLLAGRIDNRLSNGDWGLIAASAGMAFVSRKMRSPFRKISPANLFFLLFCAGREATVGAARVVGIVSRGFFRGVEDNADNMSVPQLFTGFLRRLGRSRIRANDEKHSIRQP